MSDQWEIIKKRLYRWWLYRGPFFTQKRRELRKKEGILPPGFELGPVAFLGTQGDVGKYLRSLRVTVNPVSRPHRS